LGYYSLNIPKGEIEFNFKNLDQHPDAELRNILSFCKKDKEVVGG
jgi:hypothetical protein